MTDYQPTIVPFVPIQTSVRWLNQVIPMNDQQYYRNNTNQSMPYEQERALYTPSFVTASMESSSNKQSTGMSRARSDIGNRQSSSTATSSSHFYRYQNANTNDTQRRSCSEAWAIFSGIVFTVLSLALMLMSIYLLMTVDNNTSTTTTDQIQTNSFASTQQPSYCSGVSSFALWTVNTPFLLTMNIDTSGCRFNSTPLYFTSIAGSNLHWDLVGYGAIYARTKSSFTIYIQSLNGYSSTVLLNSSQTYAWNVDWFSTLD